MLLSNNMILRADTQRDLDVDMPVTDPRMSDPRMSDPRMSDPRVSDPRMTDAQRQALCQVVVPLPETEQSTSTSAGYRCAQCGKKHQLTMKDSVRCSDCGYRVMYKLRDSGLCMRYLAR